MPRVAYFEIHVENVSRAVSFYQHVFGWKFAKVKDIKSYWLVTTGPASEQGINGGMTVRQKDKQGELGTSYIGIINVPDIDEYSSKIRDEGESVIQPFIPVPGVGNITYCRDTEGNLFGIKQEIPQKA
ncbi:MAG: VOC family protein [Patescibacteria group bacterium]|jgi:predicted enzyme related to lactoylglutathione lyase